MGEQSAPQLAGIGEAVDALMKEWACAGLAMAVVKDGQVVLLEGFGLRDMERNLPVTPETVFAIGSSSKAFTTAGMAILADEGKLDWDKPVREVMPEFRLWDSFATERMTPRDLVCHRSGLPRHDLVWYNSTFSREEIISRLRSLEPNQDFRTTWQYNNLMFMTAGYLAGKIDGTSWEELTQKRILDPLGMSRSYVSPSKSKSTANYSKPYQENEGRILEVELEYREIEPVGPAGAIFSTATDMSKWLLLHLNKGRLGDQQLVSEANMRQMHSPQMVISDTAPENRMSRFSEIGHGYYGLGWFINTYRGHETIHHGGNIDGFSATVAFLPKDNAGVVILTNQNGSAIPTLLTYWVFDRLLGLEPIDWNPRARELWDKMKAMAKEQQDKGDTERVPDTLPSLALDAYAGTYTNPGYGELVVSKEGEGLKVAYNSLSGPMKHFHYDAFELNIELMQASIRVTFALDGKGKVSTVALRLEPMVQPIVFDKK